MINPSKMRLADPTVWFYLAVAALFLLFSGFRLYGEGMFVDGVTYATVSRNLANGLGSFWEPWYTATLYPQFHEHPPLAFGIQGLFFTFFGDHLFVERFYSMGTFFLTGYLIVMIWKELTGEKKTGWIPLFLWILFPMVSWAAASNLLDNTLCIFTTLAILLIFKSSSCKRPAYLILAGFSLFAGLLTKGPFALFPWSLPVLLALTQQGLTFRKSLKNTLSLIFFTLLPLVILVAFSVKARESLNTYWMHQVVGSLKSVQTVSSRLFILGSLLGQLMLPVIAALLTAVIFRHHLNKGLLLKHGKQGILLLLLGLSAVLPVMISMKQRGFYILTDLPVFALLIALPVGSLIRGRLSQSVSGHPGMYVFRLATLLVFCVSVILPPLFSINHGRDRNDLEMIHEFSRTIPPGATIRIDPDLFKEWSLHAYFARHSQISLDPSGNPAAAYYLARENVAPADGLKVTWTRTAHLKGYVLFKK